MPSSKIARKKMTQLVNETGTGPVFDLGSGWGHLVVPLALKYPQRKIVGYELSVVPWLTVILIKKILGLRNLSLYRENFLQADLSQASVLVCYLYPDAMDAISKKLTLEENNTQFLISNNFALASRQPEKTVQLDDFYQSPIYLYRINYIRATT